jgi:hypothetical protein
MKNDKRTAAAAKSSGADSMNELRLETARRRLAESNDQEDAIEALREIVSTFAGSEEMGLFKIEDRTEKWKSFWSFGIDLTEFDLLKRIGNAGRRRVMRGECHVEFGNCSADGTNELAQAFIPIKVDGGTVAVLAILRLLPQKTGFDKSDMELFDLLSREAGRALFGRTALWRVATAQE